MPIRYIPWPLVQGFSENPKAKQAEERAKLTWPQFAAARQELIRLGRKRQGAKEISRLAREMAIRQSGGDPKKLDERGGMPAQLTAATINATGGKLEQAPNGFKCLTMDRAIDYLDSLKHRLSNENTG